MQKKIKILHILSRVYPYAGTEKKVIQLLHHLKRDCFSPFLLSLTDFWNDPGEYLASDIKIFSMAKKEGIHFSLILKIARILKRHQIDIVHSHNWATLFHAVLAAKIARVPIVIHGEHGRETRQLEISWKQRLVRKFLYSITDQIVVVSKDLEKIAIRDYRVDPEKVVYIPNGVDLSAYRIDINRNKIKKRIGLHENSAVIATIGRLKPVKDFPTLIRAFGIVHKSFPDSILLIIGGDAEGKNDFALQTKALISRLSLNHNVKFLGHIDNIPEILSVVDVYVNSSLSEGMSNTILEAMSSKIPVVASEAGGNSELVENGVTGYLFNVQDEKDCAGKVLKLLYDSSLREQIGLNGHKYIEMNHNFQQMISRNIHIYEGWISKKLDKLKSNSIQIM